MYITKMKCGDEGRRDYNVLALPGLGFITSAQGLSYLSVIPIVSCNIRVS